jgi:nucleoid DNA-binding protein
MSRRLFHGQLADDIAGDDRLRAERLRLLARSLVDIIRDALVRDGMVRIHGFGTFRLARMAARRGINPRTGEPIEIPARNRVLFRPAKALRDRIEPEHPAAMPLAEPHESREAWLGGTMADTPVAGSLPGGDTDRPDRTYFPDRVAAAAMSEPSARVTASAYPETPRSTGSREANLGGAMADSPSAGRVVTADNGREDEASGTAANDDAAVTRERDADDSTVPAATAPTPSREADEGPGSPEPVDAGTDEEQTRAGHAGRDIPVLTEPGEAPETEREERRPVGMLVAALLILLLLLLLLGWWLWPRSDPQPPASSIPGVETERTDTVVTDGPADAAEGEAASAASATTEPEAAEAVPEAGGADAASTQPPVPEPRDETQVAAAEAASDETATGGEVAEPVPGEAADSDAAAIAETDAATTAEPGEGATADTSAVAGESASEPAAGTAQAGAPSSTPWFSGRRHSVAAGDTLWDLSDRNYVNPYYWPHIWNHNQSLANPDRIEIDQVLWLPRLEGEPRNLTAADRRSIAEGYLRLYRLWKANGAANPQLLRCLRHAAGTAQRSFRGAAIGRAGGRFRDPAAGRVPATLGVCAAGILPAAQTPGFHGRAPVPA